MSYNLFLDDFRQPIDAGLYMLPVDIRKMYRLESWILVKNYNEFIDYIKANGLPKKISFDHDLSDEHYSMCDKTNSVNLDEYYLSQDREMTGYDCCQWLIDFIKENNLEIPEVFFHSMNPIGCENMKLLIDNFKKNSSFLNT